MQLRSYPCSHSGHPHPIWIILTEIYPYCALQIFIPLLYRCPDASAMAYYRRVTEKPVTLPVGRSFKYNPGTLQKWVSYFLPDDMDSAYILYEGKHYPVTATDKVANSRTKRNNELPVIKY